MKLLAAEINPLGHVMDIDLIGGENPLFFGEGWTVLGSPILTMHMVTIVLVAALVIWSLRAAARTIGTGPESEGNERYLTKNRFGQVVEVVVVYLRDKTFRPLLGDDTQRYLPYLLTLFFFILYANVLGLVPLLDLQHLLGAFWGDTHFAVVGGTVTANLAVTAGLAIIAFVVIQVHGIKALGVKGWAEHLLGGAPAWLAPIMLPVELAGMLVKPGALAIRLFANMLAGATLIGTLMLFGYMAADGLGLLAGLGATVPAVAFALFILLLKLFVSLLQAFIFVFLTAVFISQLSHHHEHEPEVEQEDVIEGKMVGAEPART